MTLRSVPFMFQHALVAQHLRAVDLHDRAEEVLRLPAGLKACRTEHEGLDVVVVVVVVRMVAVLAVRVVVVVVVVMVVVAVVVGVQEGRGRCRAWR